MRLSNRAIDSKSTTAQRLVRSWREYDAAILVSRATQSVLERIAEDQLRALLCHYSIDREELRREIPDERIWFFGTDERFDIERSPAVQPLPHRIADKIGTHSISRPFVCEFRDVELLGRHANAKAADGRYILEADIGSLDELASDLALNIITAAYIGANDTTYDLVVPLVNKWSGSYYHWFTECLPRLRGVEYYQCQTGQNPLILIDSDPPEWMVDSLRLLGYMPDDCVEWRGKRASVDRLVVPSLPRETWQTAPSHKGVVPSPAALRWVRNRVLDAVDRDTTTERSDYPTKIYISREDSLKRRVVNRDAVIRFLRDRGFETVTLSDLDFPTQVELFAQVDTVVAPHGGGLTNLIFADRANVVELFGDYVNGCYYMLSEILDCEYTCLNCKSRGEDLVVDTELLDEALREHHGP